MTASLVVCCCAHLFAMMFAALASKKAPTSIIPSPTSVHHAPNLGESPPYLGESSPTSVNPLQFPFMFEEYVI